MVRSVITITHWFPIITFCPVNSLPDFVFVEVEFTDKFAELYEVRRIIKRTIRFKKKFMEDLANDILCRFPEASAVRLRLMFNKHVITIKRNN